jgi:hypothetical protein
MRDQQPVVKNAFVSGLVLQTLGAIAVLTRHFGWWDPSVDDIFTIAEFAGFVGGVALMVQGWFVHNRTTPTANVALTKDDVQLLEAATDPQTPIGMGLLRDAAQIARDRVPPSH